MHELAIILVVLGALLLVTVCAILWSGVSGSLTENDDGDCL